LPKVNSGTLCAAKVASKARKVRHGSARFSGATPIARTSEDALWRGKLLHFAEAQDKGNLLRVSGGITNI